MRLPSGAMPWGRYIGDLNSETARQLSVIQGDANSVGNQFSARSDNLAAQIGGIRVSTMVHRTGLNFSRTIPSSGPLAPYVNVIATPMTATPPGRDVASCFVIVNFQITATTGTVPDTPMMKLNGVQFSDPNMTSTRPDDSRTHGAYSMSGSVPLQPAQPVTLEYGAKVPPFATSVLNFHDIQVWFAFQGGAA